MEFSSKIKEIRAQLKKSQYKLAEDTQVSQGAISKYEKNEYLPDVKFVIRLIDTLGINPLWLFKNKGTLLSKYDLYSVAEDISTKNNTKKELDDLLLNFIGAQNALLIIRESIEKLKGRTLFEKLSEAWSGNGTRALRILFYFLSYLDKQNIQFSPDHVKEDFLRSLDNFELTDDAQRTFMHSISDKDKSILYAWAEQELDNSTIYEIMSVLPIFIKSVQEQMNQFDKFLVAQTSPH